MSVLVAQALAGGWPGPQKIDTDWRGVLIDSTADIAQAIAQIPQDVNPLGVRATLADVVKTNIYVTDVDEFLRPTSRSGMDDLSPDSDTALSGADATEPGPTSRASEALL